MPELDKLCNIADIFSTTLDKLVGHNGSVSNQKAYIGIDGGATKSEFVLFTHDGTVMQRFCSCGCNPNVYGIDKACEVLKNGIDILMDMKYKVEGIFCGTAGAKSGTNLQKFNVFFRKTYPNIEITVDSDICNVLMSDGHAGNCALVICGTGFAIFANENNELSRVGSWGYLLDVISGGYGLGREALRAALADSDGFGEKTVITKLVKQKLGDGVWNCINTIYDGGDSFIASFASIVFDAYKCGDSVAIRILDEHVTKIKNLLDFTLAKYNCNNHVVILGGLVTNGIIVNLLMKKMNSDVKITVPKSPQILGACLKCIELYGSLDSEFLDKLKKSYKQIVG